MSKNITQRAQLRNTLLEKGYFPLPAAGKGVYIKGWSTVEITQEWLDSYARSAKYSNTGLRCDNLIAFDIDVTDESLSFDFEEMIERVAGMTDLCRVGAWPKRLLLYRLEGKPGRSMRTGKYGNHQIEVLCGPGRQFIAYGMHPNGHEYEWNAYAPDETAWSELTPCTFKQAEWVMSQCEELFEKSGLEKVRKAYAQSDAAIEKFDLVDEFRILLTDGTETTWGELCDTLDRHGVFGNVIREHGDFGDSGAVHFMLAHGSGEPCAYDFVRDCVYREPVVNAQLGTTLPPSGASMFTPRGYRELLENWVLLDDGTVRHVDHPERMSRLQHFEKARQHLRMPDPNPPPSNPNKTLSMTTAWLRDPNTLRAHSAELLPYTDEVIVMDGSIPVFNTYVPPDHPTEGGGVKTVIEFIDHLIPRESDRDLFWDWHAMKMLHPEYRMHVLIMTTRTMGTGRGVWEQILSRLVGEPYVNQIPLSMLLGQGSQGQYNAFLSQSLVVVVPEALEERENALTYDARRSAYERIKIMCEPTARRMQIARKFGTIQQERVYASTIISTNHLHALAIPPGDRRIIVLDNTETRLIDAPNNLYERIIDWMQEPVNIGMLYHTLRVRAERAEFKYDPFGMPPETVAKNRMIQASRSDFDLAFDWILENAPGAVITPRQLKAWMFYAFKEMSLDMPDEPHLKAAMHGITNGRCRRCEGVNKSCQIKYKGVQERPWIIKDLGVWMKESIAAKIRKEIDKNEKLLKKQSNVIPLKPVE